MYNKEQVSKIRQKFWTSFGQYMKPVPDAGGEKINWLNYKTGIGEIYFRMDVTKHEAIIAIEITHTDQLQRLNYYQQFNSLSKILEKEQDGAKWKWTPQFEKESGITISRISQTLRNVNLMNEADWPAIIAFLKPRIIALDAFWQTVKDGFD